MAKGPPSGKTDAEILDYRHDRAKRKNNPPAGLAAQGRIAERPTERYAYNPHLPPVLRFDDTGRADALPELLETARQRALTAEEVDILAAALRVQEPWLEWTGKRETKDFAVDAVPLNIHERVAAKAILAVAARQDVQRSLFGDPEQDYRQAVQFYQHDVGWSNRLILGDSLVVMSSLAKREDLAGKVQMIYLDPPYGIGFASNFQPQVGQRSVKDRSVDLTREPEVVKAYRDTWTLGIHSYLAYLRDRLVAARELLADTGSIFVQMGDENVHRVRSLMDEVFGSENSVSLIAYPTSGGFTSSTLSRAGDYILWYSKDKSQLKYREVFRVKPSPLGESDSKYDQVQDANGHRRALAAAEKQGAESIPPDSRVYRVDNIVSQGFRKNTTIDYEFEGETFHPGSNNNWKATAPQGMNRLASTGRVTITDKGKLGYVRYFEDFPAVGITNVWSDISGGVQSRSDPKVFVVQTGTPVIARCLLMTTDPGDLVLDPTCGSGTTAYVAEQWGRRWITIDTSRVALAIARQRLLTAAFDYYKLRDPAAGPSGGFVYKSVPHVTLKSIAQNVALDSIFARHAPILANRLSALNAGLAEVPATLRSQFTTKLAYKEQTEGRRSITDADRRRWLLPREAWREWEVPFDGDPDWPVPLQDTLATYRAAWRAKMDEVNACIAANAESEELVDQPELLRGVARVSGPFTVEAVLPPEERLDPAASPIDEPDDALPTFGDDGADGEPINAEAYLERMLRLLKSDGVRFPDNKVMHFARLEPLTGDVLHGEGEWSNGDGEAHRVAISFGPQYGPVTARQVEDCLWSASRSGYNDLVFAGFSFDAEAQATIQDDVNPRVRTHLAHIRPDVGMGNLLKDSPNSQLFTVFGLPRTHVEQTVDQQLVVTMEGVDVYDPVRNVVESTGASKVAAWFLDGDYDGRTFCICQAFFPDRSAWDKLSRALKGVVDESAFAQLSGTTSLPFPVGPHKRVAIKVIDPRGNEVMRVHRLDESTAYV